MYNILILGGSGYLGRKLLSTFSNNSAVSFCCLKRHQSDFSFIDSLHLSVNYITENELDEYFATQHIDCIVNLACHYLTSDAKDIDILQSNLFFPSTVFAKAIKNNIVNKFITIDTGLPDFFNMYCLTKKQFADLGKFYCQIGKCNTFVNIRLENFYGEDEPRTRFIANTVYKLLNNENINLTKGTQKRDFIYIEDVTCILHSIICDNASIEKQGFIDLPVGTGIAPTIKEIVKYLHEQTHSKSHLLFGAISQRENEPDTCANIIKLSSLGLFCKYSWKEGMKKMLERWEK